MKHEFPTLADILNQEGKMNGDKEKKATHTHQHVKVPGASTDSEGAS